MPRMLLHGLCVAPGKKEEQGNLQLWDNFPYIDIESFVLSKFFSDAPPYLCYELSILQTEDSGRTAWVR